MRLQKDGTKLRADQQTARSDKEAGEWKPYREAAGAQRTGAGCGRSGMRCCLSSGRWCWCWGCWRLAFTGEGAERWVAYIIIAIITFSIYIGGMAWVESVMTSTQNARVVGPGMEP